MEVVELDGVKYVKASVAAKKFKYTQDYIGQLCRGKKVDARLVGRTWFVNTDSILDHQSKKYKAKKTVKPVEGQAAVLQVETSESPEAAFVAVAPVVTNKAVKSIKANRKPKIHRTAAGERKLTIEYSLDEESLLPVLQKRVERAPKSLSVSVADAKTVRVQTEKRRAASFTPSELPEVSLSGSLEIEDYPEVPADTSDTEDVADDTSAAADIEQVSEKTIENNDISDKRENKVVSVKETAGSRAKKIKLKKLNVALNAAKNTKKTATRPKPQVSIAKQASDTPETPVPVADMPESKVETPYFRPKTVSESKNSVKISVLVAISPLMATVFALGCVLILFSASTLVVTSDQNSSSKVVLQKANLLDVLAP